MNFFASVHLKIIINDTAKYNSFNEKLIRPIFDSNKYIIKGFKLNKYIDINLIYLNENLYFNLIIAKYIVTDNINDIIVLQTATITPYLGINIIFINILIPADKPLTIDVYLLSLK